MTIQFIDHLIVETDCYQSLNKKKKEKPFTDLYIITYSILT